MKKSCDVVVLTCDAYEDAWEPFFILKDRYWPDCKYNTYLITESLNCKYCETININEKIWTKRIRTGLSKLNSDFVIILLEDFFLRDFVDSKRIDYCIDNFPKNAACFNFEISLDKFDIPSAIPGFKIKTEKSLYKCSCQAALWDRKKLIKLLSDDLNAWQWETNTPKFDYYFYINCSNYVFNYGYENNKWFGICKGKWIKNDVVPLFKNENIKVDFSKRGFYKKDSIFVKGYKIFKRIMKKLKRMINRNEN